MTRKEQLYIAADKEAAPFRKFNTVYADCVVGGFVQGAKWADEHPKEGMVNKQEFIEKACDWLVGNAEDSVESALYLVAKFKRAMEE